MLLCPWLSTATVSREKPPVRFRPSLEVLEGRDLPSVNSLAPMPAPWAQVFHGDFNGDSKQDVAGIDSSGQWWVSLSTGTSFTPRTKWAPSPDHYPILKSAGGHLVPENVRLSHVWCNNRDYGWRTQIRTMLAKGKSLADIAEALNSKGVPPAHGTNRWTAAMVRKAYVS